MKGEDLKEYVMRFNREAILILDLQDGTSYIAFLNGLVLGKFKVFLVESKVTTLVDTLRRAQDFIQSTKIQIRDDFIHQQTRKRVGEKKGP